MVEPWPGKLVSPDMVHAELRTKGSHILAQAAVIVQAASVRCVQHVSIGTPAEEIAAYAAQHGCDAIVMGTRGMGALAGLVLGSVAHKLVHLAPVPVTLVR
jgi:nucleotide-binding universal stress UspA family protein